MLQTLGMVVCKRKLKISWLDLISIQANIRRFRRRRPSEGHKPLSHLLLHFPLEPLLQRSPLRRRLRLERLLFVSVKGVEAPNTVIDRLVVDSFPSGHQPIDFHLHTQQPDSSRFTIFSNNTASSSNDGPTSSSYLAPLALLLHLHQHLLRLQRRLRAHLFFGRSS